MHTSTAILRICLLVHASADYSQEDCQPNEVFVKCGQCEGTCANHRPVCDRKCRGVRCECIAVRGFVRSKHGHCIRCADYPGSSIYYQDPFFSRRSNTHISRNSKRNQMDRNVDPTRNFRRPSHGISNIVCQYPMRSRYIPSFR
ncbi:hypothetical protein PENTCL1PPCAC_30428 [Pristionchus entomophagus]|uniref:TIL domain-containing protein n=1 Tax=Pristionchus entomophagus TaxID=358040 RepID=A0AAV5STK8_9BILA|nr:hypothetical protein PENTCL1PPCAC_8195 [Pristionchus entomophagus]GMT08254.1 hypothetical protein PENTCL1PPCAC_30428 [Pristionchus entomophagus]